MPEVDESSLDFWLHHIQSVHPREIELGLERVRLVAARLDLCEAGQTWVIVAGTNGKGSTVAALEALLLASGRSTLAYTSPHVERFNERYRLCGTDVGDEALVQALRAVDGAREGIVLSYFEFATLAALYLAQQGRPDVALLEVGLGGRLDAVNIVTGDITLITNISLDHQDWLGYDVDSIAAEKAGILRPGVPLIYADREPNPVILARAEAEGAPLIRLGREFDYCESSGGRWSWTGQSLQGREVSLNELPRTDIALVNAALALQAMHLLAAPLSLECAQEALAGLQLAGRIERRVDSDSGTPVLLDVAHNPASAALLATHLESFLASQAQAMPVALVLAVMADKDIEGIWTALESWVDICYIAQSEGPRCMSVGEAESRLRKMQGRSVIIPYTNVSQAYRSACERMAAAGLVVVTGSFLTVAAVRGLSESA